MAHVLFTVDFIKSEISRFFHKDKLIFPLKKTLLLRLMTKVTKSHKRL